MLVCILAVQSELKRPPLALPAVRSDGSVVVNSMFIVAPIVCTGPENIKLVSCSTHLSTKFHLSMKSPHRLASPAVHSDVLVLLLLISMFIVAPIVCTGPEVIKKISCSETHMSTKFQLLI